jgi:D-glycero-alpha-D-manno-heptose 1-phosphate guanylyltransferase
MGTRLRGILPNQQKVVARVAGEPFLLSILRKFQAAGINRVVLALGHRADDVKKALNSGIPRGMTVLPSIEHQPMGTGGAIRRAISLIGSNDVLVANGDSLIDYPIADLIEFHRRCHARATLLLCEVPDVSRYGSVTIDTAGTILSFQEKRAGNCYPGFINAGVYMMARTLVDSFPDGPHALETEVFPGLCGRGLYGLTTRAPFIDIGTPDDYGRATEFLAKLDRDRL